MIEEGAKTLQDRKLQVVGLFDKGFGGNEEEGQLETTAKIQIRM